VKKPAPDRRGLFLSEAIAENDRFSGLAYSSNLSYIQSIKNPGREPAFCHKGTPPERAAGWQGTKKEKRRNKVYFTPSCLLRQRRMSLWLSDFVPARQSAAFRHAGVAALFDRVSRD